MVIIQRTEEVMIRAMCGVKLTEKRRSQKPMDWLGFEETFNKTSQSKQNVMV